MCNMLINNVFSTTKKRKCLLLIILAVFFCYVHFKATKSLSENEKRERKTIVEAFPGHLNGRAEVVSPRKAHSYVKRTSSNLIIYNRLPKCASTVTRMIIARLRTKYPKRFYVRLDSYPHVKQILSESEQRALVNELSSYTFPTVFVRHVRFLDFTRFGHEAPIYINVIRDPVEQFVSAYYFTRFGFEGWSDEKVKKWLSIKPDKERFMSVEQCVRENVTKCVEKNPSRYFSYFCGHDQRCSDFNEWSLKKAKENVEKYFAVVGIAEDLKKTFYLFENYLPQFFANLTDIYQESVDKHRLPHSKTARKVNPPDDIKQKLREAMHWRMDFYKFIKKRFDDQFNYVVARHKG